MARRPGAEAIYEQADVFGRRCLIDHTSYLWPSAQAWSVENLDKFRDAFVGRPDTSPRSFLQKWREQLQDQHDQIHRIAADILAFYYLFPYRISKVTKFARLREVISWKLGADLPDFSGLDLAYSTWVGYPGPHYNTGQYFQIAFYLEFFRRILRGRIDPHDRAACQRLADQALHEVGESYEARHIALHLFFPDYFERMASENHKHVISREFRDLAGGATDIDGALLNIRKSLERDLGKAIDFYETQEVRRRWDPQWRAEEETEQVTTGVGESAKHYWVEKTIVRGRSDRENGPYALGQVLWSPHRDRRDADIYRFMRDVQPGDIILHLVDNQEFVGLSNAAGSAEDFNGVPNTEWGEGPSYLIRLRDFRRLDPPLSRDVFFGSPFKERLIEVVRKGAKNLFYNGEPNLNQGAYLTPASAELVAILNDAYRQVAGRPLTDDHTTFTTDVREDLGRFGVFADAVNMDEADLKDLLDLLRSKKQIILEGPPGSGKTYVADKLARYFCGLPLEGPADQKFLMVQFHQSYGYEDFVQGIRPHTNDHHQLEYRLDDGIFKQFCKVAASQPETPYVLIIDEINRGNLSRVFGELLLLLEYRNLEARLAYSSPSDPLFSIPSNLYIIGTMNTTDRSLAQIDYAMRRRFFFYRLLPVRAGRAPVLERWLSKQVLPTEVRERLLTYFIALNTRVQEELGEHFQVGHSYLMDSRIREASGLATIWQRAILPLLEEYFYNRRGRETLLDSLSPEALRTTPA